MDFYAPLTDLKGIGSKSAKLYEALDIHHVGALLYDFPRTYRLYPDVVEDHLADHEGEKIAVSLSLHKGISTKRTRSMDISIGQGNVDGELLELIWFRMPYIRNQVSPGRAYIFYGELKKARSNAYQLQQPAVYSLQEYERLRKSPQAVYSLTKGLTNKAVTKAVGQLLSDRVLTEEYLPAELLKKRKLAGYRFAISQMHAPDDFDSLKEARDRLVYDEFLKFFLTKTMEQGSGQGAPNRWRFDRDDCFRKVIAELPFSLTAGQEDTLRDIRSDFSGEFVSQRLLQGDVGSGKTILAFLAMLLAVENGYQAAIMAPTEVLARQHEKTFLSYAEEFGLPFSVVCITGSVKAAQRRELNRRVAEEPGLFIIGTHALLSENMEYQGLAVVVTDEQHRFGVKQRKTLSDKGMDPHVLVMSATPIPRTLAMILYSDMRISVIKDVPARRLRVKNAVITKNDRKKAFDFIGKQVRAGHQAYIICPLVEASEKTEAENVTEYASAVREHFKGAVSVGLLHGRMAPQEKDRVMEEFAGREIQVLVSTTVVEVGVNVPNATVMMIEDANRFGLAQLHQLRGRVGRGEWQSYCMFVDGSPNGQQSERLSILAQSNDGFFIANEDLRLRGPGDFYGIRQSGDLDFKLADIYQDAETMKLAASDAKDILAEDGALTTEKYRPVREYLRKMDTVVYTNL